MATRQDLSLSRSTVDPDSASLWLHIWVCSGRKESTLLGPDGLTMNNPFQLTPNVDSLIDVSDVVMVDPVATGFSVPEGDAKNDAFFGVKNDYTSFMEFIRNYLDSNSRWDSPLYLLGESYGGIRGSLLAHHLQSDLSIDVKGLILISPWLATGETDFSDPANDLPYILYFSTFANTAWYHSKDVIKGGGSCFPANVIQQYGLKDSESVRVAAETFARGRLSDALAAGSDLDPKEYDAVAQAISDFTCIPKATVLEKNLRISDAGFIGGLLDSQREVVGGYDSRFVSGRLVGQTGDNADDATDNYIDGQFTAAMNYFLETFLGFKDPVPYQTETDASQWSFAKDPEEFTVLDDLSQALIDNQNLKIYAASGIYDIVVPAETVRYNFEHLTPGLTASGRVTLARYPGGHMMYTNPAALSQLKQELAHFITGQ